MLKGFKDFVMRGNLIELAVAFIVGAAFATVVKTFTDVVMGFIGKAGGQPDFGKVTLAGLVGRPDASEMIRETISGAPGDAAAMGAELARRLLARGADRILRELEGAV